jgi:hypothetical protein
MVQRKYRDAKEVSVIEVGRDPPIAYFPPQKTAVSNQGCCKIGKTTHAGRSAEGDSPLLEREVSSLHPSFPTPEAAKREFATALGQQ